MGLIKIVLALIIAYTSAPPLAEAALRAVNPTQFSFTAVLTIVGGTVGGYITFSGAHRLLDARETGIQNLSAVNKGALSAIGIASVMRLLLFIAALGVVSKGFTLDPSNPAASVFKLASGEIGYKIFGVVIWAAGISSVVGSAYTSISFIKSFHPIILKFNREIIIAFISISCIIFILIGKPVKILLAVGAINGFIFTNCLGDNAYCSIQKKIIANYRQPIWLTLTGLAVVITMVWMSYGTILQMINGE